MVTGPALALGEYSVRILLQDHDVGHVHQAIREMVPEMVVAGLAVATTLATPAPPARTPHPALDVVHVLLAILGVESAVMAVGESTVVTAHASLGFHARTLLVASDVDLALMVW